jgi:hypothetical protein
VFRRLLPIVEALGRVLFITAISCFLAAAVIVCISHSLAAQRHMEHKDPWSYHPDLLVYMERGGTVLGYAVAASLGAALCRASRARLVTLFASVLALFVYFCVHIRYIS